MQLYDSTSDGLRRFVRRPGKPVSVYVCGITPYDTTHLGHAFTYVMFDVLIRHMETVHQWPVVYVQNITDIDDDILKRAEAQDRDWRDLGTEWTTRYVNDMVRMNVRAPDEFPAATNYVKPMQRLTTRLLDAGLAYERSGSVYFEVDADPRFGELAGLPHEELLAIANERGNVPDDPNKNDPLDFVLWQAGRPGEPAWSSPWGNGRPGWHIECSAMAMEILGEQIDIHGGGADLKFPHHTCSIAQSEPVTGVSPWVRHWMHTAMVRMDGEKMSKSLGNLVLVDDLLREYHPDTIRLYLLRSHYRTPWEWNPDTLEESAAWARTLHAAVARISGPGRLLDPGSFGPRFTTALDNDLDTPSALEAALDLADEILAAPAGANTAPAVDVLRTLAGSILGLWLKPRDSIGEEELSGAAWPAPMVGRPDTIIAPENG